MVDKMSASKRGFAFHARVGILTGLLLLCTACASGDSAGTALPLPDTGMQNDQQVPMSGLSIPYPQDSGRNASAAPFSLKADQFEATLPSSKVTKTGDGSAIFFPHWESPIDESDVTSHCIYRLGIPAGQESLLLEFSWSGPVLDYDRLSIGFGDSGRKRWIWQHGDPTGFQQFDIPASMLGETDVLIAVVLTGEKAWMLGGVTSRQLPADGDWYTGMHDNRRSGMSPVLGRYGMPILWELDLGSEVTAGTVEDPQGRLYSGSASGRFHCINPEGTLRWTYQAGGEILSSAAVDPNGKVFVGSTDGVVSALDFMGNLLWQFSTGGEIVSSPLVDANGRVVIGSRDGNLYCLDGNGTLQWQFNAGYPIQSSVAEDKIGNLYFIAGTDELHALTANGSPRWSHGFNGDPSVFEGPVPAPAVGTDGRIYVALLKGRHGCLEADGTLVWEADQQYGFRASPVPLDDGHVCMLQANGTLLKYAGGGLQLSSDGVGSSTHSGLTVDGAGRIYLGNRKGDLIVRAADGSPLSSRRIGKEYGGELDCEVSIGHDGNIYVGCNDGRLVAIGTFSGNMQPVADVYSQELLSMDPLSIRFDASCSSDPDGFIVGYDWDLDGDGYFELLAAGPQVVGDYDEPGSYLVRVRAADNSGGTDTASVSVATTSPWPMLGGNARRNCRSEFTHPQSAVVRWTLKLGGSCFFDSPVIGADGTIYVGCQDHKLYAVNSNGTVRWTYPTNDRILASPAIGPDGTIYVGSDDGRIYAINPDGGTKWYYQTGAAVRASPLVSQDGTVYIGSLDRYMYAFSPEGELSWTFQTFGEIHSSASMGSDGKIYFGSDDYTMYALDENGTKCWSYYAGGAIRSAPAVADSGEVVFCTLKNLTSDGKVFTLDSSGNVKWLANINGIESLVSGLDVDQTSYLNGAEFRACDAAGIRLYSLVGTQYSGVSLDSAGTLCLASRYGKVPIIIKADMAGNELWRTELPESLGQIPSTLATGADGSIYASGTNGTLFSIGTLE